MNKPRLLKTPLLGAVLAGALAAAPAMAEDFHALSQLPTGFTAMPAAQLASIEGARRRGVRVSVTNTNTSTNTNTTTNTNANTLCVNVAGLAPATC